MSKFLKIDDRGAKRCWWCGQDPLYVAYHDTEWGVPQHDDQRLFEKICLEGFQAGLSWITILRKRDSFRESFDDFEIARVARFSQLKIQRLLANPGIVRHPGKINAVIKNAVQARSLQQEFGSLDEFFWQFQPARPRKFDARRSTTPESIEMSRQLRKRDWKFVGPTTCYSFMQAMGIVNDHHPGCFRYDQLQTGA